MERSTYTVSGGRLESCASANTLVVHAEGYLCQYDLNGRIMSRRPDDESGSVPMFSSRELNSLGSATGIGSGRSGAFNDTVQSRSRGTSGGGSGGGVLSSDEGRSKGENGESGEAEHSGDGTGSKWVYVQRWTVTGSWMLGGVSKSNTQGKTWRVVGPYLRADFF